MLSIVVVVFIVLCVTCSVTPSSDEVANIPSVELASLYDFYNATNGPSWNWTSYANSGIHWDFSNPTANPCVDGWVGVHCLSSSDFSHVIGLTLSASNLVGYLPSSISNLTYLLQLILSSNHLQSTIPESLYSLKNLTSLYLSNNNMSGTLSPEIEFLYKLKTLSLDFNEFHGSIPDTLYNITELNYLAVGTNHFTGTLSPQLGKLTKLSTFDVTSNRLHGEVPSSLMCIPTMSSVSINLNEFTGPLPDCGVGLFLLTTLVMSDNHFSSTIPESYGLSTGLLMMSLSGNELKGKIPESLGNLVNMWALTLHDNYLTGPYPVSVARLNVSSLILENNLLSGTIPDALWNGINLQELQMTHNLFSGTISELIGYPENGVPAEYRAFYTLKLDDNRLTGSLPRSLSQLMYLDTMFVNNNRFTGNLDGVFNASVTTILGNIDVSTNQLTGTLPEEIFRFKHLLSFAASSNCFHGSLPDNICEAYQLKSLALDGLMSAESCHNRFFPHWTHINSYWTSRMIEGSLPSCLFTSLRDLGVLHLSGNGYIGSIPDLEKISPNLTDLSLSNNLLQGTIPSVIQNRVWSEKLDLSFNLLGGTLETNFPAFGAESSLYLDVNRLSGRIPKSLKDTRHISILDSNLFSCSGDRGTLPTHDPDNAQYECGSNSLNAMTFTWLFIGGMIVIVLGAAWLFVHNYFRSMKTTASMYFTAIDLCGSKSMTAFSSFLRHLRSCCNLLAAIIFVVMMTVNTALSTHFNTYTHEYAWNISSVFLSGVLPAVVLLIVVGVLSVVEWKACTEYLQRPAEATAERIASEAKHSGQRWSLYQLLTLLVVVLFNMVLIIGVNVGYVYVHQSYSLSVVQMTQFAVAVFKMFWNGFILRFVLRLTRKFNEESSESEETSHGSMNTAMSIMLFNNLAAPFLAIALISSSCFYDVITTPPAVDTSYSYYYCGSYDYTPEGPVCVQYFRSQDIRSTSYTPPFHYGYQCSSTYISVYSTIYVIMLIITTFVTPVLQIIAVYVEKFTVKGSVLNKLLNRTIQRTLRSNASARKERNGCGLPSSSVFDCERFIVKLINIIAVMLTFGVVFPPIALFCCAAVLSMTWFAQLCIGRYISESKKDTNEEDTKEQLLEGFESNALLELQAELCHARSHFLKSIWIVIPYCAVFYSFLLFDTLGDAKGWKVATAMPATIIGSVLIVWGFCHFRDGWKSDRDVFKTRKSGESNSDARLTLDIDGYSSVMVK